MMRPRIWEDEPSGEPGADILSAERERRLRRRRGLRSLLPGSWLTGRFGIAVLCIFILGGAGLIGFQRFAGPDRIQAAPAPARADRHPESGRDLTVSEYSLAARYGQPLHLGDGGLPVVRLLGTGMERELTPLEMDLEGFHSVRASPRGRIVQVPGPRGWGMWWTDRSERKLLRPRLSFDRLSWVEKQEDELVRLSLGVQWGVWAVSQLDLAVWRRGAGEPLLELLDEVRRPYPSAQQGYWSAVPGMWQCDLELEMDLHQGVTPGCPGDEYLEALRAAWDTGGVMVDRLERIARMVERMDRAGSEELYRSTMRSSLAYEIADLPGYAADFDRSLAELRRVSHEWDLYIHADFMGGRP